MRIAVLYLSAITVSSTPSLAQSCIQNRPLAIGIASVWVASEICPDFPKVDNVGLQMALKEKGAIDFNRRNEPECANAMLEVFTLPHMVDQKDSVMFCTIARKTLSDPSIARHVLGR